MFPETRYSLIERLALQGDDRYWREFVDEYWRPVCRFAMHWGRVQLSDAEDIASETFEVLLRNQILLRWTENRSAKLRTLLCSIVRKQLANQQRLFKNRHERIDQIAIELQDSDELDRAQSSGDADIFQKLWADEILSRTTLNIRNEYFAEGKVDRFRALFNRICGRLTHAGISDELNIPKTSSEAWYKESRDRITRIMKTVLYEMVISNTPPDKVQEEFDREWHLLGEYLLQCGGLEAALRQSHESLAEFLEMSEGESRQREHIQRLSETFDAARSNQKS